MVGTQANKIINTMFLNFGKWFNVGKFSGWKLACWYDAGVTRLKEYCSLYFDWNVPGTFVIHVCIAEPYPDRIDEEDSVEDLVGIVLSLGFNRTNRSWCDS
jgi:hypothetical protein